MTSHHPFRFGVIVSQPTTRDALVAQARKAEELGYSILLMPDHFGEQFAPIPALMAVVEVTNSIRVGSFVFDNDFRHPARLAKEAATIDVLSGGRFELGLGAGWWGAEYEQAGISFESPGVRVSRLEEAIHVIKGLFAQQPVSFSGNHYTVTNLNGHPKPVQKPHPPVLIGGGGKRLLSLAAREADIVSIGPKVRADGSGLDVTNALPEATTQKIAWLRQAAADRFEKLELNVIVFETVVTNDPKQAAQRTAERIGNGIPWEQVLEIPHWLIGTVEQMSEALQERRERYGISYIAIFEESMEAFAPVIARLAGR